MLSFGFAQGGTAFGVSTFSTPSYLLDFGLIGADFSSNADCDRVSGKIGAKIKYAAKRSLRERFAALWRKCQNSSYLPVAELM
jgi:hypothetical protein